MSFILSNLSINPSTIKSYHNTLKKQVLEYPLASIVATVAGAVFGFKALTSYTIIGSLALGPAALIASALSLNHMIKHRENFVKLCKLAVDYHRRTQSKQEISSQVAPIKLQIKANDSEEGRTEMVASVVAKLKTKSDKKPKTN
ncbi:MAG: hypothetical protein PVI40_08355 [Chlamydiota bacterium]